MVGISSGRTIFHVQINGKYLISPVGSKGESRLLIISRLMACIYYYFLVFSVRRDLVLLIHDIAEEETKNI
jgi:recombinational DNA repair ATPase RecF